MVCNGICDSFVMALEFSVIALLFFSAGLPLCFYMMQSDGTDFYHPRNRSYSTDQTARVL